MSGYRELQEAYEENHQATVVRRSLTRDALNGIRMALLARLGIKDQTSEIVMWSTKSGGDLWPDLALLELKDVLNARGSIALEGIFEAPPVSISFDVSFEYSNDKVIVNVDDLKPKMITSETDLADVADTIYELVLLRLTTY